MVKSLEFEIVSKNLREIEPIMFELDINHLFLDQPQHLETLLSDILDNSPLAFLFIDPNGRISKVNKNAVTLFGYQPSELLNLNSLNLVSKESLEEMYKIQNDLKQGVPIKNREMILKKKNGEKIYALVSFHGIKEDALKNVGTCCSIMDVTHWIEAEKKNLHLNRVLMAIRQIGKLSQEETTCQEFIEQVCSSLVASGSYSKAFILAWNDLERCNCCSQARFDHSIEEIKEWILHSQECKLKEIVKNKSRVYIISDQNCSCFDKCPLVGVTGEGSLMVRGLFRDSTLQGIFGVMLPSHISADDPKELDLFEDLSDSISVAIAKTNLEKNWQKAENKFRNIFRNMPSGVIIYEAVRNGEDFIIKDMNNAAEKIKKVTKTSLLGKKITEAFSYCKKVGLFSKLEEVWKSGESVQETLSYYRGNHLVWCHEYSIFKLDSGEIVTIFNDATDRKQAEQRLYESEEKFKIIAEHSQIGISIVQTGKIKFINKTMLNLFGFKNKELNDLKLRDFLTRVHSDDRDNIIKQIEGALFEDRKIQLVKFKIALPNGEIKSVELFLKEITYQELPAMLSILIDVTEKEQAEQRNFEILDRMRIKKVLEVVPEGLLVVDSTGSIILANKTFKTMFFDIYQKRIALFSKIGPNSKYSLLREIAKLTSSPDNHQITIEPKEGHHLQLFCIPFELYS
ncbi:MAG: PAS domain S-box protein, partial [Candidatus Helarchaeales archaeon]